jgi:predicted nucleotidyltransferase
MFSAAPSIELSQSVIARIARTCRYWHIRRLALFGSVLRDDYGPDSDIDVLVESEPGHAPGFGSRPSRATFAGFTVFA